MVTLERTREEDLIFEIEPAIQEELQKHPGTWAALTPSQIIAIRSTSTEAYQAARELGYDAPILFHIPDGYPRSYYY